MSVYVYAIIPGDDERPLRWRGFGGQPLVRVSQGALTAVVSEVGPADEPGRDSESVLRHEALVEAIAARGAALPVRFHTVLPSAAAVARALAEHHDDLVADLRRLGGKIELGLIILWLRRAPEPSPETKDQAPIRSPGSGTEYMRARARELARTEARQADARQLAAELHRDLGSLALERRVRLGTGPVALRVDLLTEASAVPAVRRAVDRLRGRRGDVTAVLSGPWPPYSFVTQEEEVRHGR
jgi:hypothetical protein